MFQVWYILRRKVPQSFKPVILVTGCNSGIGLAIAKLLYQQSNYRVVITAREKSIGSLKQKFQESDRFLIRSLDVTSSEQRNSLIKEICAKWDSINILINNAGISYRSVVEHMDEDEEIHQMSVNYFGPVGLIREVLPGMRKSGRGKIINISSVSGMLAMPTMASYSASKYALEGMSEALWYEGKPLGINVSLIQPGFIRSNSFKNVYYSKRSKIEEKSKSPYHDYYSNMAPFVEKLMKISLTNPESMAKLVLKVIQTENPPLWIAATIDAAIFYYLRRWIPRRFLLPILFHLLPNASNWGKGYSNRRR